MQVAGCAASANAQYKGPSEPVMDFPWCPVPVPSSGALFQCAPSGLGICTALGLVGLGWGAGGLFERVVRPAAPLGSQEHPNEV